MRTKEEMMKVKFIGASDAQVRWGGDDDPRKVLKVGRTYKVVKKEVRSWHTKLYLAGFPGLKFNSVCFEWTESNKERW